MQSWRGRPPTDRDRVSIGNSERLPPVKVESRTNIRRNSWRFFIRRHANAALYGPPPLATFLACVTILTLVLRVSSTRALGVAVMVGLDVAGVVFVLRHGS